MRYEVQHYTLCDGWINTWTCWEGDTDERVPETFSSFKDAQSALDDFLEESQWEYEEGNLESPEDRNDYRIVEVCNV